MSQKPRYTPSTLLDDVNFDYSQQAEAALKGVRELRKVVDRDRDITESDPSSSSYRNSLFAFAFPEEWKWSSNEVIQRISKGNYIGIDYSLRYSQSTHLSNASVHVGTFSLKKYGPS